MLEVVDLSWRLFLPNEIIPRYTSSLIKYGKMKLKLETLKD